MSLSRVLCVVGPTAVGKSAVADRVACELGGEVVSVDSMQVYRGMDVGTAKTPPEERLFPRRYATYVNAIMTTCGMYDGSGEFALNVGVPAKSGVGGGIMAVVPTDMGIGIFAPALDAKGNSVAGIQLLERLSKRLYLSIF